MTQTTQILPANDKNLEACAVLLAAGNLVAVPTETVYGLAGNALDENAVRKIFSVKGRPLIDPLIVHVKDTTAADAYAKVNAAAEALASRFWPGPLTLVLPKRPPVHDLLTAGLPSVGIRCPAHPVLADLLQRLPFPLAAPSANPFGYVSPTRAEHIENTLGGRIPAILDGGPCRLGIESTIIDLREPATPRMLRPGPITAEEIEEALHLPLAAAETQAGNAPQNAPGSLSKHYSPRTAVKLFPFGEEPHRSAKSPSLEAVIKIQRPEDSYPHKELFWFSEDGSNRTVAENLYDLIQRVDRLGYRRMHIEMAQPHGIGQSVNDRLRRAAAKA